tara:strand:+ start:558 stop:827 length:270 start_codon:yes stop_codon:yes gene_type:complete
MKKFSDSEVDRIIQMCWEDRTPFDAIKKQFDLSESEIISVMRKNLKKSSFVRWRKRIDNRKTKHSCNSKNSEYRFKSKSQKQISLNKIK